MPPFQNPDETAHFHRVDQIAHGGIIAVRFAAGVASGGMVDLGPDAVERILGGVAFHPAPRSVPPCCSRPAPCDGARAA